MYALRARPYQRRIAFCCCLGDINGRCVWGAGRAWCGVLETWNTDYNSVAFAILSTILYVHMKMKIYRRACRVWCFLFLWCRFARSVSRHTATVVQPCTRARPPCLCVSVCSHARPFHYARCASARCRTGKCTAHKIHRIFGVRVCVSVCSEIEFIKCVRAREHRSEMCDVMWCSTRYLSGWESQSMLLLHMHTNIVAWCAQLGT